MLIQKDYFAVYGDKLQQTATPYEAWLETEKEFARRYSCSDPDLVLRRYTTYDSFHAALRRWRKGIPQVSIEIVALSVSDIHWFWDDAEDQKPISNPAKLP